MRIGEIAAEARVSTKTIRFWESAGLLGQPARTAAGYRDYEPSVIERLDFIRYAQGAGFRLDQIRQVLDIGDSGEPACEHVRALITERLAEVDRRLAELKRTRRHLTTLATVAAQQDPADCHGYCKILLP
jgi:MerR family transcriptional regulator, copper efflux regulator